MAKTRLQIHLRPDATPRRVLSLLGLLAADPGLRFETVAELIKCGAQAAIGRASEMESVASLAQMLGLLERDRGRVGLSSTGLALARAKESAQADLLHFLFYTRWTAERPTEAVKSWAYRHCLDAYWDAQTAQFTLAYLDQQVQETINDAERTFGALGIHDLDGLSFSRKSLGAVHQWLSALRPPVIDNQRFARRAYCPPELLLLAVGHVFGDQDGATDTDVLLSREKREAICRLCLLDTHAFDQALDWTLPIFPEIMAPGTTAGFYGRFIRLARLPALSDVAR